MDLDIIRIHDTPMKLVFNKDECIGCFWYGDNFVRVEGFTPEQRALYDTYHATTFKERFDNA